jgi:hypothetical protein
MKTKIAFTILVLAGIVAGVIGLNHRTPSQPVALQPKPAVVSPPPVSDKPSVPIQVAESNPPPINPPMPQVRVAKPNVTKTPVEKPPAAEQSLVVNGYAVQDPDARVALSYVGTDPDAEAYWIAAINDPNLPAKERKDLIEDLNEDGLANPRLAAPEDLPVIANRIQLIEELAPLSMDQANYDAFGEAYKDLMNLYNGLPAD